MKDLELKLNQKGARSKLYFLSDFHLGSPDKKESLKREKRLISLLEEMSTKAHSIFFLGDVFDFWMEYRHVVPKGYVRFLGKVAELSDQGINIYFFKGNHDMWMFGYLKDECGAHIITDELSIKIGAKKFLVGHGDGLGPGDTRYKMLKKIFRNPICIWLFRLVHPDLGIGLANAWSQHSRTKNLEKGEVFLGEKEWLWQYCKKEHEKQARDYYIFGHRHLNLDLEVIPAGRYINLGEWITDSKYVEFDGKDCQIKTAD